MAPGNCGELARILDAERSMLVLLALIPPAGNGIELTAETLRRAAGLLSQ